MDEHNHIMELLGAFLTGVVGPILYLLIDRYKRQQIDKKRDKVKETIVNTIKLITEEIEEIRNEFESCRVWISQFHNGGNFYPTDKSIPKVLNILRSYKTRTHLQYHIFSIIFLVHFTHTLLIIC